MWGFSLFPNTTLMRIGAQRIVWYLTDKKLKKQVWLVYIYIFWQCSWQYQLFHYIFEAGRETLGKHAYAAPQIPIWSLIWILKDTQSSHKFLSFSFNLDPLILVMSCNQSSCEINILFFFFWACVMFLGCS